MLQLRHEMPQQHSYQQSIQPGGDVVEDDTPAFRQALKLAGGKRLGDIEEAEEDEGEDGGDPVGRAEEQGDPLAGNFVDDDKAGIVTAAFAGGDGGRGHSKKDGER